MPIMLVGANHNTMHLSLTTWRNLLITTSVKTYVMVRIVTLSDTTATRYNPSLIINIPMHATGINWTDQSGMDNPAWP